MKGNIFCKHGDITNVSPVLKDKIKMVEADIGEEIEATSVYRCPECNAAAGGTPGSTHLIGLAIDISARNSSLKFKLIEALIKRGFTRLGVGKNFIHADLDPNKAQCVVWTY